MLLVECLKSLKKKSLKKIIFKIFLFLMHQSLFGRYWIITIFFIKKKNSFNVLIMIYMLYIKVLVLAIFLKNNNNKLQIK